MKESRSEQNILAINKFTGKKVVKKNEGRGKKGRKKLMKEE